MSNEYFRSIYSKDDAYWAEYSKGRPQIPDSFFERVFQYHADHGGKFDVVHEPGAGGGIHTPRLASKFDKVIVTDPSEQNIQTAQRRLQSHSEKLEFHVSKLEDTITLLPAKSIDMVFAAVMIHFTEIDKALTAIVHQLKPGGSFIALLCGMMYLEDPQANDILTRLYQAGFDQQVFLRPDSKALMPSLEISASGYDSIPLSEDDFEPGALRIKIHDLIQGGDSRTYRCFVPEEFQHENPPVIAIGPKDKVSVEEDEAWSFRADFSRLKSIMHTVPFDHEAPKLKALWNQLADVVADREVAARWVVCCLMATKK